MEHLKPYNLGETGKKEAIPYLIKFLQNGSVSQRIIACSAVKKLFFKFQLDIQEAIPHIIENLTHEDSALRECMLKTIVDLPLAENYEPVLTKIFDHDTVPKNKDLAKKILTQRLNSPNSISDSYKSNNSLSDLTLCSEWNSSREGFKNDLEKWEKISKTKNEENHANYMMDESDELISTSVLARKINLRNKELFKLFEINGFSFKDEKNKWRLTQSGKDMGGRYKTTPKGHAQYIVWPARLAESDTLASLLKKEETHQQISSSIFNSELLSDCLQRVYQNSTASQIDNYEENGDKYIELTTEQEAIINQPISHGQVIKIIAFAGTGKTTTVCEYAKKYQHECFLYLAYNKSVQIEATRKFPSNVSCRTAHSLAFREYGHRYRNKLVSNIKAFDVSRLLGLNSYRDGSLIIKILNNYLNSKDKDILLKHFPKKESQYTGTPERKRLIDLTQEYLEMMIDENNMKAKVIHDVYLKLYQLSDPILDYDCILVDEAQDLNPVIFDIVNRQECAKIFIGDSHQQIYAFRGAIDAMDIIEPDYLFYITNSFRFNPWIGQISSSILKIFKNEKKQITGLAKEVCTSDKQTIITRTNAGAFAEAVKFINKSSLGFVGGSSKYRFEDILDVFYLYDEQFENIKNPFYKNFNSFEDFNFYAVQSDENESKTVIRVVEEFKHNIPIHLAAIYEVEVLEKDADIIITTAHKAKGLEWNRVIISQDFKTLCRLKKNAIFVTESFEEFISRIMPELQDHAEEYFGLKTPWPHEINELNLIYVAVTRAKKELKLNIDLNIFIKLIEKDENLRYLLYT
jgi:F-box protein, helicase, 18